MGYCKDCKYYIMIADMYRRLLTDFPGCSLTGFEKDDYDSCEYFEEK